VLPPAPRHDRTGGDDATARSDAAVLVARVRRRVVVPDPTEFDEAEWVEWDGLVSSVRAGTLPLAAWSAQQVELLAALGPATGWSATPPGRL
jgi:isopentenyldiphosphate isomerase